MHHVAIGSECPGEAPEASIRQDPRAPVPSARFGWLADCSRILGNGSRFANAATRRSIGASVGRLPRRVR